MSADPENTLEAGRHLLSPIMKANGFVWQCGSGGAGSGGNFARGEFLRNDRRLKLHFRYSLGLVAYHIGRTSLTHSDYMRIVLGDSRGNKYPGFSQDPLDGFRQLAHDLTEYCSVFLSGTSQEFVSIAKRALAEPGKRRLP